MEYRLLRIYHTLNRATTDLILKSVLIDSSLFFVPGDRELKFMGIWIYQDEKATFCFHYIDHFIHDQAQHLIEFKFRVEDTCYFVKGFPFVSLALEVVDTDIEDLTLTFEGAGWRRELWRGTIRERLGSLRLY